MLQAIRLHGNDLGSQRHAIAYFHQPALGTLRADGDGLTLHRAVFQREYIGLAGLLDQCANRQRRNGRAADCG